MKCFEMKFFKSTFLVMISRLLAALCAILLFNHLNSVFEKPVLDNYFFTISITGLMAALCSGSLFQITTIIKQENPELLPRVRFYAVSGLFLGFAFLSIYLMLVGNAELILFSFFLLSTLVFSNYLLGIARAQNVFASSQISHAIVSQLAPLLLLVFINNILGTQSDYHPLLLFVFGQILVVTILNYQCNSNLNLLKIEIRRLPKESEKSIRFLNLNSFFSFASNQIPYVIFPFVSSNIAIASYYFIDRIVMFSIMAANVYDSASLNNYSCVTEDRKFRLYINDFKKYLSVGLIISFFMLFTLKSLIEILSLGKVAIQSSSVIAICIYVLFKYMMGPFMRFYTTTSRSKDVLYLNIFFVLVTVGFMFLMSIIFKTTDVFICLAVAQILTTLGSFIRIFQLKKYSTA